MNEKPLAVENVLSQFVSKLAEDSTDIVVSEKEFGDLQELPFSMIGSQLSVAPVGNKNSPVIAGAKNTGVVFLHKKQVRIHIKDV